MRLRDGLATMHGPGKGSGWRWFPWAVAACMTIVFAVNGTMVWFALGTFPGQAGSDGFDLSNHYDRVLDAMRRQAALGWTLDVSENASRRPVVVLTGRDGAPLAGARVEGVASRPVGPAELTDLTFQADATGRFVAQQALSTPGQWELQIVAHAQNHRLATTKRIVLDGPVPRQQGQVAKPIGATAGAG